MAKNIQIKTEQTGHIRATLEEQGKIHCLVFAPGSNVSINRIREEWRNNRREFAPYNQSTGKILVK